MKNYFNLFLPPVFSYVFKRFRVHNFKKFWKKIKNNKNLDQDIKLITNEFINSESYNYVSNYWHFLNIKNFKYILEDKGIENYSVNIAKNYFTTLNPNNTEIKKAVENLKNEKTKLNINIFKKHDAFSYVESINYNIILVLLFENLKKTESFSKLENLKDIGFLGYSDPYLEIENLKITHDKLNSLFDFDYINKSVNTNKCDYILEIGAGSGRTSETLITFNKKVKYVICDIPPASYISYQRLKKTFPEKKIGLLYASKTIEELSKNISKNDISFIFPHQLKSLKKIKFDLTIAIDCLHEMDKKIIKFYLSSINKISKNFYFSVKNETLVPFSYKFFTRSGNLLKLNNESYPIPKNWELNKKEEILFPGDYTFFSYKIKNNEF